jgi:hypothetical protein
LNFAPQGAIAGSQLAGVCLFAHNATWPTNTTRRKRVANPSQKFATMAPAIVASSLVIGITFGWQIQGAGSGCH